MAVIITAFVLGTFAFVSRMWILFSVSGAVLLIAVVAALKLGILRDTRT